MNDVPKVIEDVYGTKYWYLNEKRDKEVELCGKHPFLKKARWVIHQTIMGM